MYNRTRQLLQEHRVRDRLPFSPLTRVTRLMIFLPLKYKKKKKTAD